jgi:head-tail adaptor
VLSSSSSSASSSSSSQFGDETQSQEEALIKQHGEMCTIQRRTATKTNRGTQTYTWTNYKSMYAWLQPAAGSLRERYMRREMFVTHSAYVAEDPGVSEGDRLVDSSSTEYIIHSTEDQAGLSRLWMLPLEETKNG